MMKTCIGILLAFFISCSIYAQDSQVSFLILEQDSKLPVAAAHVFLLNSTIGNITDAQGKCKLTWPKNIAGQLVVSHIAYENQAINISSLDIQNGKCTITLKANNSSFNEVVVTATRDTKWKRHYRTFQKAFLGEGVEAEKCQIINPEVLRFDKNREFFKATATNPLEIKNDYLGYHISYILEELVVENDGSKHYIGQASFEDLYEDEVPKSIARKRNKTFLASRRHFFQTLINNDLENQPYEITINTYDSGYFIEQKRPERNELLALDESSGFYKFYFSEFLQVVNFNLKNFADADSKKITGIESGRFNSTQTGGITKMDFPISQLYKVSSYLLLDPYGNVYNTSDVKEYGFWANQRLASMLPLNYKIELKDTKPSIDSNEIGLDDFKSLSYGSQVEQLAILTRMEKSWNNGFYAPLLELVRLSGDEWLLDKVRQLLKDKSDGGITNYYDGLKWLWNKAYEYPSYYSDFKAELYKHVDSKFEGYFKDRLGSSEIRIDEVMWGGVEQDGIPPLRMPKMLSAEDGNYLDDDDIIFGFYINGVAKAYPKRILAWHEFFVDDFDGTKIAGVYCTLCGTVIGYDMTFDATFHDLGTSGFLYRSNKLMYDKETQSLWSTIEGKPVIGPLAGTGIALKNYPVVTTTWGAWKESHPRTWVLSLETGHRRNYDEGEAYKDYYATDVLMFPVPREDSRLQNKSEVLVIKQDGFKEDPIAISIDYLKRKNIYQDIVGSTSFVVIAEADGLAKVYESGEVEFDKYKHGKLTDKEGNVWEVSEEELLSVYGESLGRIPAHNIFWFAWVNAFPGTRLVR